MQRHIIYIPGILDNIGYVQSNLVRLWRWRGVHGHTHSMPWTGEADYQAKMERLLSRIDSLVAQGCQVSLVGASAGATAAINAYVLRPDTIAAIALICPKVNNSHNVSSKLAQKNPSFMESLRQLEATLPTLSAKDKTRIASFVSPTDNIIPHADSTIAGVQEFTLPALPHNRAILYSLSFGLSDVLTQLKRIAGTA